MDQILAVGTILDGRYKITRVLASDPQGGLYEVRDVKITEKVYAAREFFAGAGPDAARIAVLQTLNHPGLLRVLHSFTEQNRSYLIVEETDGLPLEAVAELSPGPVPETDALEWLSQLCEALDYLHRLSFFAAGIHPSNIFLNRDGRVKMRVFRTGPPPAAQEGREEFQAPELREKEQEISAAADIYSLGAIFYFLLTRQIPRPEAPPAKTLNPALSEKTSLLLGACLRPWPEERPQDAQKVRLRVEEILHPVLPVSRPAAAAKSPEIFQTAKKIFQKTAGPALAFVKRPYLLVLTALAAGAAFWSVHPWKLKPFHKTGPLIYAAYSREVIALNPADLTIADRIFGIEKAFTAAAPSDFSRVWLAAPGGKLFGINPQNDTVMERFSLNQPIGGISAGGENRFFASLDHDNAVGALNSSTGKLIAICPTNGPAKDLLYNRGQNELYAATSGLLTVINPDKLTIKQTVPLDAVPARISQSADGKYIAAVFTNPPAVEILDAASKTKVEEISLPGEGCLASASIRGITAACPRQNTIAVYGLPAGEKKMQAFLSRPKIALYPDGVKRIFVFSENGYLYSLNATSGKILQRVRLGGVPSSAFFVP